MSDVRRNSMRAYVNVMEVMVEDEVKRQLAQLPPRVLKYVKAVEVETYALNRLPSLYASSEKGWKCQYDKASASLHAKVSDSVRQAIAAVQVDPIRSSQPLPLPQSEDSAAILSRFRKVLRNPELTWDSLLQKFQKLATSKSAVPAATDAAAPQSATHTNASTASAGSNHGHRVWRPGTYGETSWRPKRQSAATPSPNNSSGFDWGDSRYRS